MARINANVHRGVYALSEESTADYEGARAAVAAYLNTQPEEIVFTQGTTHAINLVAASIGRALDCDYYCFSAHKLMGLTGTGVLYARRRRSPRQMSIC